MAIVEITHVTKEFQLGQLHTLKTSALNQVRRLLGKPVERGTPFKALDDVSLTIQQGEVVGIIGHNGAGKSTLLKLLANISKPTYGQITVRGKVAPLIEVGAGLVGDLTGRENIYLNGAILGIPKREIDRSFEDIVAFAELEEFIETPIKRYSSGMQVRLGFAIATSVRSDILIVDEVLAVGDLAFQRKCFDRMEEMIKRQGKTVLLVSHNIRQVERLCSRAILLEQGRAIRDGEPQEVCDVFYEKSDLKIRETIARRSAFRNIRASGDVEIIDIALVNEAGADMPSVKYREAFSIRVRLKASSTLKDATFGFGIHTTDFLYLATHNSEEQLHIATIKPGLHEVQCAISNCPLLPGVYSIRFGITEGAAARTVFYAENILRFQVVPGEERLPITAREGFFEIDATWRIASSGAQSANAADLSRLQVKQ
jgi:ABC-type polysaccharide/polyol phosphate transport system ATPase subunit